MWTSLLCGVALFLSLDSDAVAKPQWSNPFNFGSDSSPSETWVAYAKAQIVADAVVQSQRIGKLAPSVNRGNPDAMDQLGASQKRLTQDLNLLATGGQYRDRTIPGASTSEQALLENAKRAWSRSARASAFIIEGKTNLVDFYATLKKMNTLSPQLLETTEQVAVLSVRNGGTPREISAATQLVMLNVRLGRNANLIFVPDIMDPETAFMLGKDANSFRDITDGLLNGNAALGLSKSRNKDIQAKLIALQSSFVNYQQCVKSIMDNLQNLVTLKQAEMIIATENENLKNRLLDLQETFQKTLDDSP